MSLLSLTDSFALDRSAANELYGQHLNPGLLNNYGIMGTAKLDVVSAEGMEIRLRDGRSILDFSSSIGVLAVGHNHPRIVAAERACHEAKELDATKLIPHKLQAALAHNIAQMLPDPLEVCFLSVSGAEAVEAALKICEKAQGPKRTKFITMDRAYHGKTHGAMALTTSGGFQRGFLMGIPAENVIEVEYDNVDAARQTIETHANDAIALIVEPIQGEGLRTPKPGYLKQIVELCRQNGILSIIDEVKAGMGRTGTFLASQIDDVVPDVVTLSKALGGGKRALGAMVSSRELFNKAYGSRKDCALHTSTFSGLGETCAVGIETLNIYQDEKLIEGAREKGNYLRERLEALQLIHPSSISELRGRGLMQGVRLKFDRGLITDRIDSENFGILKTVEAAVMVALLRALQEQHNIMAHFAPSAPDVLHIMPPLIAEKHHLDQFVDALDSLLNKGFARIVAGFVGANVKDRLVPATK